MQKRKDFSILILLCIILLCILALLYLYNDNKNSNIKNEKNNYYLLDDYSRFFTVNSCVYKYFSYLSNRNTVNLLSILDKNYISENDINHENIYDKTLDLNTYYSFTSKKMYYRKLDDGFIEYYVYGYSEPESINLDNNRDYYYFKVVFDEINSTFTIAPINSDLFKEVSNE